MKVTSAAEMIFNVHLILTEDEARALVDITKYGDNAFIETFYAKLGKSDLQKHEKGLRSLFASARKELPKHLEKIDQTRNTFITK